MTDRPTITSIAFNQLPLFATDEELAKAIVGKARAAKWLKERLPALANKPAFPAIDAFHGGRPVPLVKLFYESYLGMTSGIPGGKPDGGENLEVWTKPRSARKAAAA